MVYITLIAALFGIEIRFDDFSPYLAYISDGRHIYAGVFRDIDPLKEFVAENNIVFVTAWDHTACEYIVFIKKHFIMGVKVAECFQYG